MEKAKMDIAQDDPYALEIFRADIRPYLERKVASYVEYAVNEDLAGNPVEFVPADYFDVMTNWYFAHAKVQYHEAVMAELLQQQF